MGQGNAAMGCTHELANNHGGAEVHLSKHDPFVCDRLVVERSLLYCNDRCGSLDCEKCFNAVSHTSKQEAWRHGALPPSGYSVAGAETPQGVVTASRMPEACWLDRSIFPGDSVSPLGFYETGGSSSSTSSNPALWEAGRSPGSRPPGAKTRAALAALHIDNASRQVSPRSMSPRSQASWDVSSPNQLASHLKLTKNCFREKAISQLEQAVVTKNISLLRVALETGTMAGMPAQDLNHVRAFLQDYDDKEAARSNLAYALQTRKIKALQDAIRQGEHARLPANELEKARALLAMEETHQKAKESVRSNLESAVASGNTERVRNAILDFEDAGMNLNSKLLAMARGLVALADQQKTAQAALRAAVAERRIDKLQDALQEGRIAALSPEELHAAHSVLVEEQQKVYAMHQDKLNHSPTPTNYAPMQSQAQLHRELSEAVSSRNAAALHDSIVKGIRGGLHPDVLRIPLDILQEEEHGITRHASPRGRALSPPSGAFGLQPPSSSRNGWNSPGHDKASFERFQVVPSDASTCVVVSKSPPEASQVSSNGKLGMNDDVACKDRFTGLDSLQSALRDGDTVLVKGSWLMHCAATIGELPRRQQLPPEAVWDVHTLLESLESSPPVQIVAVSYCWRTADHPDPRGELLKTLNTALEYRLGSHDDIAVFLDWCSLPQQPWKAPEAEAHLRALRNVDLWYAHQRTAVWFDKTPGHGSWPFYDQRGWPWFELSLSSLATPRHMLLDLQNFAPESNHSHLVDLQEGCHSKRIPPLLPEAFSSHLDARYLSVDSDRSLLQEKYTSAFKEVLGSTWELDYQREDWGDIEVEHLSLVLPHCPAVAKVNLSNNRITDDGAATLAKVIPLCGSLRTLRLIGNRITKAGKRVLVDAWKNAGRDTERLTFEKK